MSKSLSGLTPTTHVTSRKSLLTADARAIQVLPRWRSATLYSTVLLEPPLDPTIATSRSLNAPTEHHAKKSISPTSISLLPTASLRTFATTSRIARKLNTALSQTIPFPRWLKNKIHLQYAFIYYMSFSCIFSDSLSKSSLSMSAFKPIKLRTGYVHVTIAKSNSYESTNYRKTLFIH